MSTDSAQIEQISEKKLGFSEFWQTIASEMGNSRLKIDPEAESIKYFLAAESDHRDFLRALIHQSYKRCRCYHLNARFDVNVVLDMLGETNHRLQGTKEDDLLDVELLEDIAWLIDQHYRQFIRMPTSMLESNESLINGIDNESPGHGKIKHKRVLSLSKLKIRRANKQL